MAMAMAPFRLTRERSQFNPALLGIEYVRGGPTVASAVRKDPLDHHKMDKGYTVPVHQWLFQMVPVPRAQDPEFTAK